MVSMDSSPNSLEQLLSSITPEIHQSLKTAIELGRWDNGERLTPEQVELCMQAVIAYDEKWLPEQERVAYVDKEKLESEFCGE